MKIPYPSLNFPPASLLVKKEDEKTWVFDVVRKKYILLTPEEWVRQHLISHLIHLGYPPARMAVEKNISINGMKKRVDVLVYNQEAKPFLLVECKAFDVQIEEKVLRQLYRYNYGIGAPYVGITNGMKNLIIEVRKEKFFSDFSALG